MNRGSSVGNRPPRPRNDLRTIPGQDVRSHLDRLWPVLTREPAREVNYSSRLPLPYRYVVPGGRFDQMYYWDSYFTMLGLQTSGQHELLRQMCDNFAFLVERYSHKIASSLFLAGEGVSAPFLARSALARGELILLKLLGTS